MKSSAVALYELYFDKIPPPIRFIRKPNPNSSNSYSVYKKRNYSVPYIFGFGRIIRIRLNPIPIVYSPKGLKKMPSDTSIPTHWALELKEGILKV